MSCVKSEKDTVGVSRERKLATKSGSSRPKLTGHYEMTGETPRGVATLNSPRERGSITLMNYVYPREFARGRQ